MSLFCTIFTGYIFPQCCDLFHLLNLTLTPNMAAAIFFVAGCEGEVIRMLP